MHHKINFRLKSIESSLILDFVKKGNLDYLIYYLTESFYNKNECMELFISQIILINQSVPSAQ